MSRLVLVFHCVCVSNCLFEWCNYYMFVPKLGLVYHWVRVSDFCLFAKMCCSVEVLYYALLLCVLWML